MNSSNLDIVNLIERNPITRLNKDINYNNKIVEKLKTSFTNIEQQLFLSSFYCYLNYDKEKDFVIELNKVWKWLGFSRIDLCKRVLEKHFVRDIDYKIEKIASQVSEVKIIKDIYTIQFLLNFRTFKSLCIKCGTQKGEKIYDYFELLEDIIREVIYDKYRELNYSLETINKKFSYNIENLANLLNTRKDGIKRYLIKHFKKNIDYIIYKNNSNYRGGAGNNKENIFITDSVYKLILNSYNLKNRYITKFQKIELCNPLLMSLENSTLGFLQVCLEKITEVKRQYKVGSFFIDCYIPEFKLAIECDENNHISYDQFKELERENFIKKQLGCKILRFNPNETNFHLGSFINTILQEIYFIPN